MQNREPLFSDGWAISLTAILVVASFLAGLLVGLNVPQVTL